MRVIFTFGIAALPETAALIRFAQWREMAQAEAGCDVLGCLGPAKLRKAVVSKDINRKVV